MGVIWGEQLHWLSGGNYFYEMSQLLFGNVIFLTEVSTERSNSLVFKFGKDENGRNVRSVRGRVRG